MFNLNDTRHEAGIILYGENAVGVYNWMSCGDNELPMVSPFGSPICWPASDIDEESAKLVHTAHVDDIRDYLPGTVRQDEDSVATDMDIVYDVNDDLPALFGIGPSAADYDGEDTPYAGDIWELPGGYKVITIDIWN